MTIQLVIADRTRELVTTPPGTASFDIAGAVAGWASFASFYAASVPFPYAAFNDSLDAWEEGIGWLSSGDIVRNVIRSSNSDALVNFSSGTTEVVVNRHSAIFGNECMWGTGTDGAKTFAVGNPDVTLTEDVHYLSLAWNASATGKIITNGYRVRVLGLCDLTNCPAGGINADAALGVASGWGTLPGGATGIIVGGALNPDLTAGAILGGRGGDADTPTNPYPAKIGRLNPFDLPYVPAGQSGGTTGAGTGGAGAGTVELWARRIQRTNSIATGAIRANGGDGTTDASGGGAGRVRVFFDTLAGTTKTGAIQANGGEDAGAGNEAGDGGASEVFNMRTGVRTFTQGSSFSGGTIGTLSADI